MDGITPGAASYIHELIDTEITFARGRRADGVGFIGEADMQRLAINVAEDRDGMDTQFAAGAQDAHGDLTAIGDQDFPEHTWFAMLRNFNMCFGGKRLAVRLACLIVCGVRKSGELIVGVGNDNEKETDSDVNGAPACDPARTGARSCHRAGGESCTG